MLTQSGFGWEKISGAEDQRGEVQDPMLRWIRNKRIFLSVQAEEEKVHNYIIYFIIMD
jgi:hypothetical protein